MLDEQMMDLLLAHELPSEGADTQETPEHERQTQKRK